MRSGNPALKASTFDGYLQSTEEKMTLEGTVFKSGILLVLLISVAAIELYAARKQQLRSEA